ncbi:MAG: hypothetical protein ACK4YM_10655 [Novosphingobium sp.]
MQRYDIGRVFGRAFAVIRSGMGSIGLFLLAITVVTQVAEGGLTWLMQEQWRRMAPGVATEDITPLLFSTPLYWLAMAVAVILSTVGTGGAIWGYARLISGSRASLDQCLTQGIARFLPVLGLSILWWLGIMLGFMVLIIPAVILIVIWSAALPALVVERAKVFAAFGRSRSLTRGSRGPVFITLLLLLILLYAPAAVLGASLLGGVEQFVAIANGELPFALIAGSTVYGWIFAMVLNAFLVSIHHELIEVNEGGSTGDLAEVFG